MKNPSVHPLISALAKHKAGVVLIVLQVAITLAIVCNAVFIIGTRMDRVTRPTGIAEDDLFVVTQQWSGVDTSKADAINVLDAMQREDLAAIRGLPDVLSATPMNSLPLMNSAAWNGGLGLAPSQPEPSARVSYYFTDETALATLGIQLSAGRQFAAPDVGHVAMGDPATPPAIIVTDAVAGKLFPAGDALGKPVYLDGAGAPSTIVGVIPRLQTPGTNEFSSSFAYNAILVPSRINATFSRYVIRARPGRLAAALHAVPDTLYHTNAARVIADDGIQTFHDIRQQAYRADVGMAALMGGVSLILLVVTATGIFALTSFWVEQRKRQIGIRRALGARRRDILRYFQIENLLIVSAGATLGLVMAVALNMALIARYEMARLPISYALLGLVVVVVLSQVSTWVPARKASRVDPAIAIRDA
ncbi:ABC transporter permease [Luteibacter aegosomaticola]|uniref:ABC transporter permease n=1 Tax=Luteibacter aegosomaticola TaxID=2911538 RepID=UPI001FFAB6DC|nr:FtsX-like permease family protein [Luteibacter aegosomaticola]UPG89739.1 ABC transporter permease [Luteibacter aegosomaticola]